METELLTKKSIELLGKNKGLFLGETHGSFATVEWFTDSLADMKKSGVTRIYLEYKASDQKVIDDYYSGKPGAEERLQRYIHDHYGEILAPGIPMAQFQMIQQAKKEGIKIVFVDNPNRISASRDTDNAYICNQIEKDQKTAKEEEKYVVYFGSAHSYKGYDHAFAIGGIDERLSIPSIDIKDSKSAAGTEIVDHTTEKGRANDYEATIPVSKNQTSLVDEPLEKYRYNERLTRKETEIYDTISQNVPKEKWNDPEFIENFRKFSEVLTKKGDAIKDNKEELEETLGRIVPDLPKTSLSEIRKTLDMSK